MSVDNAIIFEEETKYRSFKVIVGEEHSVVYVNPHFLGEFSPFFDSLFFKDFPNARSGIVELPDVNYDDFIEFLLVMGADSTKENDSVNASNCALLLSLAAKWDVTALRHRCVTHLEFNFNREQASFDDALDILVACEETNVEGRPLLNVASRLASFGKDELMDNSVYKKIKSSRLAAAISEAASSLPILFPHFRTIPLKHWKECQRAWCSTRTYFKCANCHFILCANHMAQHCYVQTDDNDNTPNNQKYAEVLLRDDFVKLDLKYFE